MSFKWIRCSLVLLIPLLDAAALGLDPTALQNATTARQRSIRLDESLYIGNNATDVQEDIVRLSCEVLNSRTRSWSFKRDTSQPFDENKALPALNNETSGFNYANVPGAYDCTVENNDLIWAFRLQLLTEVQPIPKSESEEQQLSEHLGTAEDNYTLVACSVAGRNVTLAIQNVSFLRGIVGHERSYLTISFDDEDAIGVYQCTNTKGDRVLKPKSSDDTSRRSDDTSRRIPPWETRDTVIIALVVCGVLAALLLYPIRSAKWKSFLGVPEQVNALQRATDDASKSDLLGRGDDRNNNESTFVTLGGCILRWVFRRKRRGNAVQAHTNRDSV